MFLISQNNFNGFNDPKSFGFLIYIFLLKTFFIMASLFYASLSTIDHSVIFHELSLQLITLFLLLNLLLLVFLNFVFIDILNWISSYLKNRISLYHRIIKCFNLKQFNLFGCDKKYTYKSTSFKSSSSSSEKQSTSNSAKDSNESSSINSNGTNSSSSNNVTSSININSNGDGDDNEDENNSNCKIKSNCQSSTNKNSKLVKDDVTQKLESEIKRLKHELQTYRSVEADLRTQIVHAASLEERIARSKYTQAQTEFESLKIKLQSCKERIESDKKAIEIAENKLAEEKKLKILDEQKFNEIQEAFNTDIFQSTSDCFDQNCFSDGLTCIARKKRLEQELKTLSRELTMKDAKILANRTNVQKLNEDDLLLDEKLSDMNMQLNSITEENQRINLKIKEQEKSKQDLISAYLSSTREVSELTSELAKKDYKIVELKNQIELLSPFIVDPMKYQTGQNIVNGCSPTNSGVLSSQTPFQPYTTQNGKDNFEMDGFSSRTNRPDFTSSQNPLVYRLDSLDYHPPSIAKTVNKSRILNSELINSRVLNKHNSETEIIDNNSEVKPSAEVNDGASKIFLEGLLTENQMMKDLDSSKN